MQGVALLIIISTLMNKLIDGVTQRIPLHTRSAWRALTKLTSPAWSLHLHSQLVSAPRLSATPSKNEHRLLTGLMNGNRTQARKLTAARRGYDEPCYCDLFSSLRIELGPARLLPAAERCVPHAL